VSCDVGVKDKHMSSTARICVALLCTALATPAGAGDPRRPNGPALVGTWQLASLYDEDADGEEAVTFGLAPKGRLVLDGSGHFSVQIFDDLGWGGTRCDRRGVGAARDTAASGTIAYYGSYEVDRDTLRFRVEAGLRARSDGRVRVADYGLADGRLDLVSSVLPSLTGSAYSHLVWERIE
jgi:hypothetical protein